MQQQYLHCLYLLLSRLFVIVHTCSWSKMLTRMKRYLSGGGSLLLNMDVSVWRVCRRLRATAAFLMRSYDALVDTVSRDSASAMNPERTNPISQWQTVPEALEHRPSHIISYPDSLRPSSIYLAPLSSCLSWPRCRCSNAGSPTGQKIMFNATFLYIFFSVYTYIHTRVHKS